jgi:hypothetical protein
MVGGTGHYLNSPAELTDSVLALLRSYRPSYVASAHIPLHASYNLSWRTSAGEELGHRLAVGFRQFNLHG